MLSALIFVVFTAITGYSMGLTFGKTTGRETAMAAIDAKVDEELSDAQQQIDRLSKENEDLMSKNKESNENSNQKNEKKESNKSGRSSSKKSKVTRKTPSSSGGSSRRRSGGTGSSGSISIPNNLKDGAYEGEAQGYDGAVRVKVTVSNGKISDITVLSHNETPGYYEKGAKVIGKILSAQNTNVDSISGATFTSDAIKSAVANALRNAGGGSSSSSSSPSSSGDLDKIKARNNKYKKQIEDLNKRLKHLIAENEKNLNFGKLKDGTYEGEGRGFKSKIKVSVKIKNNKIANIDIISHGDDESYFNKAKGILSKIVSKGDTKVDTISNATISSNGIKSAVNDALRKAGQSGDDSEAKVLKETIETINKEKENLTEKISEQNKIIQEKNDEIARLNKNKPLKDGTYQGSGIGFQGRTTVVEVKLENGKIKDIKIISSGDDKEYIEKNKSLIENIISQNSTNVDTVTGATFTGEGIKEAVTNALKKAIDSDGGGNSLINEFERKVEELKKIILRKDSKINSKDEIIGKKEQEISDLKKKINELQKSQENGNGSNSTKPDSPNNSGGTSDVEDPGFKIPSNKNGKFKGKAKGHYGKDVEVEVTVSNGMITDLNVLKNEDDMHFLNIALHIKEKLMIKDISDIFKSYNEYEKLSKLIMSNDNKIPEEIKGKIKKNNPGFSNHNEFSSYAQHVSEIIKAYMKIHDSKSLEVINTTSGATRTTVGILNAVKDALK